VRQFYLFTGEILILVTPELMLKFKRSPIHDVVVKGLRKFVDERGWLAELFRHDELEKEFYPTMSYISSTMPGVQRGPHEHVDQADLFCFIGPSNFKLRMWDNREDSPTYLCVMTLFVGEDNPQAVIVPKGVVHAYKNVGHVPGIVINCPNRLFMGEGKREPIDEIRHEDDPNTVFKMD
jgi:dTDP-4-dehydrorhamnose 3,5-epimerase